MIKKNELITFSNKIKNVGWNARLLLVLMTLSLVASSITVPITEVSAYPNMLYNGDMENWSSPNGPAPDSWSRSYGDITARRTTDQYVTGNYAAAVTGTSGSITQTRTSSGWAGTSFTYGWWVLDNVPGSVYFRVRCRDTDTNTYYGYAQSSTSVNSPDWQFLTTTVSSVLASDVEEFNFDFYCTASGSPIFMDGAYLSDEASFPTNPIPVISHPDDVYYGFGDSTPRTLSWIATDASPAMFFVDFDGVEIDSGPWTSGSPITVNIEGLSLGAHTYDIRVSDAISQFNYDTVIVNVVLDERIAIDGNSELAAAATTNGWPGDGSSGSPYLITDNVVNLPGPDPAITINNTTDHFIMSNVSANYGSTGYYFNNVVNGKLINCSAITNEVGIVIEDCQFFTAEGNIVGDSTVDGIRVIHSTDCEIINNDVSDSTLSGIYIENSLRTNVELNTVSFNSASGIYISSLSEPTIYTDNIVSQNIIFNNLIGITNEDTTNTEITDNEINTNTLYGLLVDGSNTSDISGNLFEVNGNFGLSIDSSSYSNTIYYNSFFDNNGGTFQGNDDGGSNSWYSGTEGNLWSEYTGTGTYNISGTASSVDLYPVTTISINGPTDFFREEGEIVNIVWTTVVSHPGNDPVSYTVDKNGTQILFGSVADGNWSNTIPLSLTGLEAAIHIFDLTVLNSRGDTLTDTVTVGIGPDVNPPTISSPIDFSYEQGSLGYSIIWSGTDNHPWEAAVRLDGVEIYNQTWIGEDIIIDLDALNLTTGTYTFICYFVDVNGNLAQDTVVVTVDPLLPDTTDPLITPPVHLEYIYRTTGHNLTFTVDEAHPKQYQWFLNETSMGTFVWRGENIVLFVDNLAVGFWRVNVTVFDLSGNNATASATIQVNAIPPDFINPTVSEPSALNIYEYQPGTIVWDVHDEYPDRFIIYQDGLIVKQGIWSSGIIQYSFTTLSEGTYVFNLTVWDLSGNWESELATVTVAAGTATESVDPLIANVPDQTVTYGTTGNLLIFKVFDEHPNKLTVLMNTTQIYYSLWLIPNQVVTISLDSLLIGAYIFKITAEDLFNNTAELSVAIQVVGDNSPPIVSSPASIETTASGFGSVSISWTVSDDNLKNYEVVLVETGEILSSDTFENVTTDTVEFLLPNLEEGEYTIRIQVYDDFGNYAMDDVAVTIKTSQSSPGFEILTLIPIVLLFIITRFEKQKSRRKLR